MFADPNPESMGIAGAAVAIALMKLLLQRGIISTDDARAVLQAAQEEIKDTIGPLKGGEASGLLDRIAGGVA